MDYPIFPIDSEDYVPEAIFCFVSDHFDEYCSWCEEHPQDLYSDAEWVQNLHLDEFSEYCQDHYGFAVS